MVSSFLIEGDKGHGYTLTSLIIHEFHIFVSNFFMKLITILL